jgi:hypothetical protein
MGVPYPPSFLTVYRPVLRVLKVCTVQLPCFQAAEIFRGFYKLLPCTMKNEGHAVSEYRPYLEYAV